MDPIQVALLKQAAEIVQNANSQGWAVGLVALACVMMFIGIIVVVRWFMAREGKSSDQALTREEILRSEATSRESVLRGEALEREKTLREAIDRVDAFGRNTLVGLVEKSTVAMNNVARATEGCLTKQSEHSKG